MRIVQLSDIHLNKENLTQLRDFYMESLLNDLQKFHIEIPIDVILITGDLIDKGGDSFGVDDPYNIFKIEILDKIVKTLNITTEQILMIPGNHDVQRSEIEEEIEYFLNGKLTSDLANERSEVFHDSFNKDNKRIKRFKEFEKEFHKASNNYLYSNNESLKIVDKDGKKLGILLVNDSWRCSAQLKKDSHFIGYRQLFRAKSHFSEHKTDLNIVVFHHPLNAINDIERDEINTILKTSSFDISFFGHSHRHEADQLVSPIGGYLSINGRSAFLHPKEQSSLYQPGYNIVDIDIDKKTYYIQARKFIYTGYRFDKDTDSLQDGYTSGQFHHNERLFVLADDSNNQDKDLPNSYTADVDRIVSLLIGKSIYPDKYAFVREIIQNSVDACNRVKEKHSHVTPKITININPASNFIEFIDQGDGMSKNVIKNHFAVLGKSISQDYNDNTGNFNLISKFGIGFISTFIAGEKILINTKSKDDEQVFFEIENVFKGFKYIPVTEKDIIKDTGTIIKVFLKKDFDTNVAFRNIRNYCRHIDNLEIIYNDVLSKVDENWNVDDVLFTFKSKNHQYEMNLGLSTNGKNLIASYCGFLISHNPYPIIPFMFPSNIGGEINFLAKAIDFDISRTNIIPSEKAEICRKEISITLRKLFRDALEGGYQELRNTVVGYLQFYLQQYDSLAINFERSYSDFYSKRELMSLCAEYTVLKYNNSNYSLATILTILKSQSIDAFYLHPSNYITDYQAIVIEYLQNKGNLVVQNISYTVNFHGTSQQNVNLASVIQMIASEQNISMFSINNVPAKILVDMKLDKTTFDSKLQLHLTQIELEYSISIDIGIFNKTTKPSVRDANQIFINRDHETFISLLKEIDHMSDEVIKIYLLGLMSLPYQN